MPKSLLGPRLFFLMWCLQRTNEMGLLTFWKFRPFEYSVFHLKSGGRRKGEKEKKNTQKKISKKQTKLFLMVLCRCVNF